MGRVLVGPFATRVSMKDSSRFIANLQQRIYNVTVVLSFEMTDGKCLFSPLSVLVCWIVSNDCSPRACCIPVPTNFDLPLISFASVSLPLHSSWIPSPLGLPRPLHSPWVGEPTDESGLSSIVPQGRSPRWLYS